jgi:RNA polymerase sigma factor (sigma-70 family)
MTDEELIVAFAASSSPDLFAEIVDRFRGLIHYVTWSVLHNEADADDSMQEAFLGIWKHADTFRADAAAKTWIWQIALNAARDLCRQNGTCKRRCVINFTDSLLKLFPARLDPAGEDDDVVAIREAVANLPEIHRSVIQITELEERKYEAAAAELGIQIGTVRSRRHRALKLLREMMPEPTPTS